MEFTCEICCEIRTTTVWMPCCLQKICECCLSLLEKRQCPWCNSEIVQFTDTEASPLKRTYHVMFTNGYGRAVLKRTRHITLSDES